MYQQAAGAQGTAEGFNPGAGFNGAQDFNSQADNGAQGDYYDASYTDVDGN